MSEQSLWRMARAASPLFVAFLSIFLLRTVELHGVASAGSDAITGVGVGGTFLTLIVGMTTRLFNLASVEVSHAVARQDAAQLRAVWGAIVTGSVLAAALLGPTAAAVVLIGPHVGLSAGVAGTAAGYLAVAAPGAAMQAVVLLCGAFILSQVGRAGSFTRINAAGVLCHAVLVTGLNQLTGHDPALVGPVVGASYTGSSLLMLALMRKELGGVPLLAGRISDSGLFDPGRFVLAGKLAAEGLPIALARAGEAGLFAAVMAYASTLGSTIGATFAFLLNGAMLLTMWPAALAQIATNDIAFVAAHDPHDPRVLADIAHRSTGAAMALTAAPLTVLAVGWGILDSSNFSVCRDAVCLPALLWVGFIYLLFVAFDGAVSIHLGALRAVRDVRTPFVALMVCYWGLGYGVLLLFKLISTPSLRDVFIVLTLALAVCALFLRRRMTILYLARSDVTG